jgi:hypothetical protein
VGQERRLVDPPSHVVAGVRTVTTKNWVQHTPMSLYPFYFVRKFFLHYNPRIVGDVLNENYFHRKSV